MCVCTCVGGRVPLGWSEVRFRGERRHLCGAFQADPPSTTRSNVVALYRAPANPLVQIDYAHKSPRDKRARHFSRGEFRPRTRYECYGPSLLSLFYAFYTRYERYVDQSVGGKKGPGRAWKQLLRIGGCIGAISMFSRKIQQTCFWQGRARNLFENCALWRYVFSRRCKFIRIIFWYNPEPIKLDINCRGNVWQKYWFVRHFAL